MAKMKRILITIDDETWALLEQYRSWGKPASWMIRHALKSYEKNRKERSGGKPTVPTPAAYEEAVVELD